MGHPITERALRLDVPFIVVDYLRSNLTFLLAGMFEVAAV